MIVKVMHDATSSSGTGEAVETTWFDGIESVRTVPTGRSEENGQTGEGPKSGEVVGPRGAPDALALRLSWRNRNPRVSYLWVTGHTGGDGTLGPFPQVYLMSDQGETVDRLI